MATSIFAPPVEAYEAACWRAIAECRTLTPPHEPTTWIHLIRAYGAVDAADRVLRRGEMQADFDRLVQARRPDLTVEWSVIDPCWSRIFGMAQREAARWRLMRAGVAGV